MKIRLFRAFPEIGFFGQLNLLLSMLEVSDRDGIPLYVDWRTATHYADDTRTNLFELLFEQPFDLTSAQGHEIIDPVDGVEIEMVREYFRFKYWEPFLRKLGTENFMTTVVPGHRETCSHLVARYLRVRPELHAEVDRFYREQLTPRSLAVHIRGTDMRTADYHRHRPTPPLALFFREIDRQLKRRPYDTLFFCSDDQELMDLVLRRHHEVRLMERYGRRIRVVVDPFFKSPDGQALHHSRHAGVSRTALARGVLVKCLLLARGAYLIKQWSNISTFALFFNPHLPFADLTNTRIYTLWHHGWFRPQAWLARPRPAITA